MQTKMTLKRWIENRERSGLPCFSHGDVASAFPTASANALSSALSRFCKSKRILAVHRGFYCVIPAHYALSGEVPPFYYIGQLMAWLGKPYYAALLTAASLWGASHQKIMVAQIMTLLPHSSFSILKNHSIDWIYRKRMPEEFIVVRNGETGPIRFSNAELTALDLVRYADQSGGLQFVTDVLGELRESTDFTGAAEGVFRTADMADIQRLGYIFDAVLQDSGQAEVIRSEMIRLGRTIRPVPLLPGGVGPILGENQKWRIRVNMILGEEEQ